MPRNGERLDVSRDGYFAHLGISNSMLSDYLDSPRLYYGRYVAKTIPKMSSSPQMRLGTLAHYLALEPKAYAQNVVVPPKVDRRTKSGRLEYDKWQASLGQDSVVVDADEKAQIERMVDAVRSHSLARTYVFDMPGESEVPLRWECEDSDLTLKALLDRLVTGMVIDLKFMANPKPDFWKSYTAKDRGYHRQAAHYLDGVSALTGVPADELTFLFIAVQNKEPFDIYCHRLTHEFLAGAREELRSLKRRLKMSLDTGNWYPPGSLSIQTIEQPLWSYDAYHAIAYGTEDNG
jgi:hypothetical protein